MRQSTTDFPRLASAFAVLLGLIAGVVGCEKHDTLDTQHAAATAGGIVCLTPAGTDLLVAMGLSDRIVGVSPYEANEQLRRRLPKLGDYERIDWERIAAIKPGYLIVQGRKDRMPAGQRERAQLMGIKPIILQIDRLADVRAAMQQLGQEIGHVPNAAATIEAFDKHSQQLKVDAPATPVRTLLTFSDEAAAATHVVGRETFLDDALTLAGGANVIEASGYPSIDREKLLSLKPQAVFVLLPGATDAAAKRAEEGIHAALPLAAVHVLTNDDVLMPGTCAMKLAETMAADLRPKPAAATKSGAGQ